jgi:hypothetical protein
VPSFFRFLKCVMLVTSTKLFFVQFYPVYSFTLRFQVFSRCPYVLVTIESSVTTSLPPFCESQGNSECGRLGAYRVYQGSLLYPASNSLHVSRVYGWFMQRFPRHISVSSLCSCKWFPSDSEKFGVWYFGPFPVPSSLGLNELPGSYWSITRFAYAGFAVRSNKRLAHEANFASTVRVVNLREAWTLAKNTLRISIRPKLQAVWKLPDIASIPVWLIAMVFKPLLFAYPQM